MDPPKDRRGPEQQQFILVVGTDHSKLWLKCKTVLSLTWKVILARNESQIVRIRIKGSPPTISFASRGGTFLADDRVAIGAKTS